MNVILRDLIQIYFSLKNEKSLNLGPIIPYRNYIKWLKQQDKEKGLNFWKEYLNGYENPVGLIKFGKGKAAAGSKEYKKDEYDYIINGQLTAGMNQIARENRVTDNIIFQTIWGILLHLYNDAEDIVYGIVVSGRPAEVEGIENMVGIFINTLPMRITIDPTATISQLAKEIQRQSGLAKPYEFIPLAEIQAISLQKTHLIDHIVGYENYPAIADEFKHENQTGDFQLYGRSIQLIQQGYYNLSVTVVPGEQLLVRFFFNANIFDKNFVRKIGEHLEEIIHQVVDNPNLKLRDIVISDDLSKAKSNAPEKEYINFEF
jgi:non-ribosomal peptide synthetase component F